MPSPEKEPDYPKYASISRTTTTSDTNSITVEATLQNYYVRTTGYVYCAAFTTSSSVNITTVGTIKQSGSYDLYELTSDTNSAVSRTIAITDLQALTSYDVYCFTETSSGIELPLVLARKTKTVVTTACCKSIGYTNKPAYVYGSVSKYNFLTEQSKFLFEYTLDASPSETVIITPTLYSGTVLVDSTDITFTPTSTALTSSSSSLDGSFYLDSSDELFNGAYTLVLNITGSSASEYYTVHFPLTLTYSSLLTYFLGE
jgi:hypothetical protein